MGVYNIGRCPVKTPGRKIQYSHSKIKSLLLDGKQDPEIADEVGCSYSAVVHVRRKLGIIRGRRMGGSNPTVDVLKIKELYSKGEDVAQIADEMNCSKATVYYWLQLKKHRGIVEAE